MIDLDGTFFVQLIIFFISFIVLYGLVFRPMIALFEAREEAIDGAKEEALRLQSEVSDAGSAYEEKLRDVRKKASLQRDALRTEGQHLERSLIDEVKKELAIKDAESAQEFVTHAKELRGELQRTVPTLASQIASKLLQREVQ